MRVHAAPSPTPLRYCGRSFIPEDLETIRRITEDPRHETRRDIARAVCAALHWTKPDGQPKLVSCHVALQRMEAHGVIWLPLPTRPAVRPRPPRRTPAGDPGAPITGSRGDLRDLRLVPVTGRSESSLWNELVDRYHYLGRTQSAGAQCRYLAWDGDRVLAALGFGASAWRLAPRDRFVGWTDVERQAHLHEVVQNRRLLVLPWVSVKGLASSILSLAARRLPADWEERAGFRPLLLETFVEQGRFSGTCYAAANWVHVGHTQGRGRNDRTGQGGRPVRDVWLLPLHPRFRALLTDGRLQSPTGRRLP
jgi:hypothetical protein